MAHKIFIIGSAGLLGSALMRRGTESGFEISGMDRDEIDVTNSESITKALASVRPEFVINAAAMTDVEGAETAEGERLADALNGQAVGALARACIKSGIGLIQISTDYVFNGTTLEGKSEAELPREAMNAYGRSKLKGELQMIDAFGGLDGSNFKSAAPRGYLVRTSWLFGPGSRNFVGKILERAHAGQELRVVDDEVGCPTYVDDLADRLFWMISQDLPGGIYHVTGQGPCSRLALAKAILEAHGIALGVEPAKLLDFPRRAHIAPISVLRNTKLPIMPAWQDMVQRFSAAVAKI